MPQSPRSLLLTQLQGIRKNRIVKKVAEIFPCRCKHLVKLDILGLTTIQVSQVHFIRHGHPHLIYGTEFIHSIWAAACSDHILHNTIMAKPIPRWNLLEVPSFAAGSALTRFHFTVKNPENKSVQTTVPANTCKSSQAYIADQPAKNIICKAGSYIHG